MDAFLELLFRSNLVHCTPPSSIAPKNGRVFVRTELGFTSTYNRAQVAAFFAKRICDEWVHEDMPDFDLLYASTPEGAWLGPFIALALKMRKLEVGLFSPTEKIIRAHTSSGEGQVPTIDSVATTAAIGPGTRVLNISGTLGDGKHERNVFGVMDAYEAELIGTIVGLDRRRDEDSVAPALARESGAPVVALLGLSDILAETGVEPRPQPVSS